jgi:hypothetical protein
MRYGTVKITRPDCRLAALQQHAIAARFEVAFFTESDNTILGWRLSISGWLKSKAKPKSLKHGGNGGKTGGFFNGMSQTIIPPESRRHF